jgi:GTP-binding protein Era
MLRRIGSESRPGIEQMIGQRVYLELWVKPRDNWRDDPNSLHWLGYKNS